MYALHTMIQEARGNPTCSWIVEGFDEAPADDAGGRDSTLRRVG